MKGSASQLTVKVSIILLAASVLILLAGLLIHQTDNVKTFFPSAPGDKSASLNGNATQSGSDLQQSETNQQEQTVPPTKKQTNTTVPPRSTEQAVPANATVPEDKKLTVEKYLENQGPKKSERFAQRDTAARGKVLCLTFDDGPVRNTTPQLLDILKKYNARCTFFVVGSNIKGREDILKRMVDEGHTIGNHSLSHQSVMKQKLQKACDELNQVNDAIESASGYRPICFRPPYGDFPRQVEEFNGMWVSWWSFDSEDWRFKDAKKIAKGITEGVVDEDIILLHDIHSFSVDSMEPVLQKLLEQGYSFVTYEEMMGLR